MPRLSADPASEPPMPVSPTTTPGAKRTRPARAWPTIPTSAALPTTSSDVVVAAAGSWPATYTRAGTATMEPRHRARRARGR